MYDIASGDTERGPKNQGLAKAVFTVFVVAKHFKHSRNMNCLNLVKQLSGRPCLTDPVQCSLNIL